MAVDIPDCKDFTGYKPCHPGENGEPCIDPKPRGKKILIINIGAMGAVLMTSSILPAVKRKYPDSTVYWLTSERIIPLLENNPCIDRVYPFDMSSVLVLQEIKFDAVMNTDKVHEICALTNRLKADEKLGFGLNEDGVIIPLNSGSEYNYRLGIDNKLKFRDNNKTYLMMLREMCGLDHDIDDYVFQFTEDERKFIDGYKSVCGFKEGLPVIGINTGSSGLFKNKRIPYKTIELLIEDLFELNDRQKIVLVGGLEDEERNLELGKKYPDKVVNTPTTEGLRRGMAYVDICDIVITADSLGMHMAIALGKIIIGWFNVTCAPEIEFYGRGEKIISQAECSPCWKQECNKDLICLEENIRDRIIEAYKKII
ncbi:glycosyltransferase family 9 protein [candidate division KSB1 bacterium]